MGPVLCSDCTPSSHNPVFFSAIASIPAQLEVEVTNVEDIVIHPGRSFFNFENCMFKIVELGDNFAMARAIQTRNDNYIRGENYRFSDLNIIKQSIKDMLSNTN